MGDTMTIRYRLAEHHRRQFLCKQCTQELVTSYKFHEKMLKCPICKCSWSESDIITGKAVGQLLYIQPEERTYGKS